MNYKTVEEGYREASSMQWREVTPMPSAKNGLRGASVDGVFHVVGFFLLKIKDIAILNPHDDV